MKKHLFYSALWGILALSTLFSCRTEDGAITQKQLADKRFNVFVQTSVGEKIDYANGFAYLMKRGDELYKSNISGINNKTIIGTLASAGKSTSAFQDTEPYIEFNIRSEITTEKNGDKWLVFPKVQGNKVIALVLAYLSKQETNVNYYIYEEQHAWFKENVLVYQNALNTLQKKNILSLSASIKPMAGSLGCRGENGEYIDCTIPGVTITVPGPANSSLTGPDGGPPPSGGGSSGGYGCEYYNSCYPTPSLPDVIYFFKPKYYIQDLKKYLSCLNLNQTASLQVFAESMDNDWPGHAFISITQGDNRVTFGFYPNNPDGKISKSLISDGIMGDNSESIYTSMKNYGQISSGQLKEIIDAAFVFDKRDYNLSDTNCSTFAMLVMTIAGEKNPPVHPSTPNNIIRRFGNGEIKGKGKGPNTQRTCGN
ncbi:hypothetical protein [Elizabethkingia anophelis]|uniref:hypothetical protein n=1 Tax=Elizabethkingia anophelis TaxID=1117645 RepID=UPI0038918BFE